MKPILGILSVWQGDESKDRPFGLQTSFFEAIHKAAYSLGIGCYVFFPQNLGNTNGKLRAYSFQGKTWIESFVPFPHVVYDRIPFRSLETAPDYINFKRSILKHTGGRMFNRTGFFSKWQIYSQCKKDLPKDLLLPKTEMVVKAQSVIRRASDWEEVWLKPDAGSLGRGVYRLVKEPFGFTLESSDHSSMDQLGETELLSFLKELLSNEHYLIQQGISRAEYNRHPFDIRILVQKNGNGKFVITNQFARLAAHGQIVSNLHAGANGHPLKDLLTQAERSTLRKHALACAQHLDSVLPGTIGELGLDMILDRNRRFWFLEANAKPFLKMEEADPRSQKIAKRIVEFAIYLCKQPPKHTSNLLKKQRKNRQRKKLLLDQDRSSIRTLR
jgi:glutathione synthase/RimK-type ligase-like ATP-grasp enzyme